MLINIDVEEGMLQALTTAMATECHVIVRFYTKEINGDRYRQSQSVSHSRRTYRDMNRQTNRNDSRQTTGQACRPVYLFVYNHEYIKTLIKYMDMLR